MSYSCELRTHSINSSETTSNENLSYNNVLPESTSMLLRFGWSESSDDDKVTDYRSNHRKNKISNCSELLMLPIPPSPVNGSSYVDSINKCVPSNIYVYGASLRRQKLLSIHLSASAYVLMYAIPVKNRTGGLNKLWRSCTIVYRDALSVNDEWTERRMLYLGDDDITSDMLYRVVIPKCKYYVGPDAPKIQFYLTDAQSDDKDFPLGKRSSQCRQDVLCKYYTLTSSLMSLRDGEIIDGDRVSAVGIVVCFVTVNNDTVNTDTVDNDTVDNDTNDNDTVDIRDNESNWSSGVVLHFYDTMEDIWRSRDFSKKTVASSALYAACHDTLATAHQEFEFSGVCTLLSYRSLTFAIRNKTGQRWVHPIDCNNQNFHITFPGVYIVSSLGGIVDVSNLFDPSMNEYRKGCQPSEPEMFDIGTPRHSQCSFAKSNFSVGETETNGNS